MMVAGGLLLLALGTDFSVHGKASPCSGRGESYAIEEGNSTCVCWGCFAGLRCERSLAPASCTITADSSAPAVGWGWWRGRGGGGAFAVGADYRPGDYLPSPYPLLPDPGSSSTGGALEHRLSSMIRALHALAGNAQTDGYHIVVGVGASQLLPAATWATASRANTSLVATARTPYYPALRESAMLSPGLTPWRESAATATLPDEHVLEWLTIPNNPDGTQSPPLHPRSPHLLHDLVYYWPSLVPNGALAGAMEAYGERRPGGAAYTARCV